MAKYQVVKGYVMHNGALQARGSIFDANPSEVRSLVLKGVVSEEVMEEEVAFDLPTPEDFSKMTSGEQKSLLKKMELDPASNEEQRIVQYREAYEGIDDLA